MAYRHDDSKNNTKNRNGNKLKQNNIEPGSHTLTVFEITKVYWSKKELKITDSIDATIETVGFEAGTVVSFTFKEFAGKEPERILASVDAKISGDKATVSWKYPVGKERKTFVQNYNPSVYFKASIAGKKEVKSPYLPLYSDLVIKLETETGKPVSGTKVGISLCNGRYLSETTDNSGMVKVQKVPPSCHKVRFPEAPTAERQDDTVADPFQKVAAKLNAYTNSGKVNLYSLITLYYYCLHKNGNERRCVSNTSLFEVVPDTKGKDKYKDEVTILSHKKVSLTANGKSLVECPQEAGMFAQRLVCEQEGGGLVPEFWKLSFWKGLAKPDDYVINGLPKSLTVKCYRPDTFKLLIKFPPIKKMSGGVKYTAEVKNIVKKVKSKSTPLPTEFKLTGETKGFDLTKGIPAPFSSTLPVAIQRNGQTLTLSFLKSVGAIIDLADKINFIVNKIKDNVPKAGFYFDWENQFLQGTFVVEWGWKEYSDHRAYYYIGFNIDVKLIELKLELGVGVSGFGCAVQIFGSVTGAVSLSLKGSRISPDGEKEIALPFSSELLGLLGARAKVAYCVEMEGGVETGLKLDDGAFKWSTEKGFSMGCKLRWTGIVGKLKVSANVGKKEGTDEVDPDTGEEGEEYSQKGQLSNENEQVFVGPADLGSWEWPTQDYKYTPKIMPKDDFLKMFIKKLKQGPEILVYKSSGVVFNDYLKPEDIAPEIAKIIHAKDDLKFDCKTAEAIAIDIRASLERLMIMNPSGAWTSAHMKQDKYHNFLRGGKLNAILAKYVDPLKTLIKIN